MYKTKKKGKIISVLAEKIYLARKNLIKIIFFMIIMINFPIAYIEKGWLYLQ